MLERMFVVLSVYCAVAACVSVRGLVPIRNSRDGRTLSVACPPALTVTGSSANDEDRQPGGEHRQELESQELRRCDDHIKKYQGKEDDTISSFSLIRADTAGLQGHAPRLLSLAEELTQHKSGHTHGADAAWAVSNVKCHCRTAQESKRPPRLIFDPGGAEGGDETTTTCAGWNITMWPRGGGTSQSVHTEKETGEGGHRCHAMAEKAEAGE